MLVLVLVLEIVAFFDNAALVGPFLDTGFTLPGAVAFDALCFDLEDVEAVPFFDETAMPTLSASLVSLSRQEPALNPFAPQPTTFLT